MISKTARLTLIKHRARLLGISLFAGIPGLIAVSSKEKEEVVHAVTAETRDDESVIDEEVKGLSSHLPFDDETKTDRVRHSIRESDYLLTREEREELHRLCPFKPKNLAPNEVEMI